MRSLIALFLTFLLSVSCSDPKEMPAGSCKSLLLVIENPWKVATYLSEGEDLSARSRQLLFHFLDSGILRVDNEDESYVGYWHIVICSTDDKGEGSYCLELNFTLDSKPYHMQLPDGLWLVESFSSERLVLSLQDQSAAGQSLLVLERVK